jgi:hypothetical protein
LLSNRLIISNAETRFQTLFIPQHLFRWKLLLEGAKFSDERKTADDKKMRHVFWDDKRRDYSDLTCSMVLKHIFEDQVNVRELNLILLVLKLHFGQRNAEKQL